MRNAGFAAFAAAALTPASVFADPLLGAPISAEAVIGSAITAGSIAAAAFAFTLLARSRADNRLDAAEGEVSTLRAALDRMPVLLRPEHFDAWLTGALGAGALKPASESALREWPVSKRMNHTGEGDDDPTAILPASSLGL